MDREEMRTKVTTYKELMGQGWSGKKVSAILDADRHVMFMLGLYTLNAMSLPPTLDGGQEMSMLRGLCATHVDLGIEKLKALLAEGEPDA